MLNTTVLKSADFGEYTWTESAEVEGCDTFADYEYMLAGNGVEFEVTDELNGRIHNQQGRVYKFPQGDYEGAPQFQFEMVWQDA